MISRTFTVVTLCISSFVGTCLCQTSTQPPTAVLQVSPLAYTKYPSMEPITAIRVNVADVNSHTFDAVARALQDPHWNCFSPGFYTVATYDTANKTEGKQIEVTKILPEGRSVKFTNCSEVGQPGSIDLLLGNRLDIKGNLIVHMYYDRTKKSELGRSDGKLSFPGNRIFTFSAAPQAAPNESLTNGLSRYENQLAVNLADANLLSGVPANFYAKSKDLFSTDGKDSKSSFLGTVGVQKGFFSRWYAPLYLEQGVQGNQTASNLSTVTNFGITTLAPWARTKSVLNNKVISAPLPPDLSLVNGYTHRINQLVNAKSKPLAVNDFTVNPSLAWKSISFPLTCRLLERLNNAKAGEMNGYCVGTELNLGLWYLPLDLTPLKNERAEGYGDVSILIPLAGFKFVSHIFPLIGVDDPTKAQIRIKWEDSVNAANNYTRTRQWTYGIEIMGSSGGSDKK